MRCVKAVVMLSGCLALSAQAAEVTGKVTCDRLVPERVVVYLTPKDVAPPKVTPTKAKLSQKGSQFHPAVLPVPVGSEVDLSNDDFVAHSVYSMSLPKVFDFGLYGPTEKRALTFDKTGPVEVGCFIHPDMGGVILVLDTPYVSRPGADGRFVIRDVLPGKYTLHVFQKGAPEQTKEVVVPARGKLKLASVSSCNG